MFCLFLDHWIIRALRLSCKVFPFFLRNFFWGTVRLWNIGFYSPLELHMYVFLVLFMDVMDLVIYWQFIWNLKILTLCTISKAPMSNFNQLAYFHTTIFLIAKQNNKNLSTFHKIEWTIINHYLEESINLKLTFHQFSKVLFITLKKPNINCLHYALSTTESHRQSN